MRNNNFLSLMDNFFDDTFRPVTSGISRALSTSPSLNVTEFDNRYEVSLTVPGINPEEISVELHEKVLTINYEHKEEDSEENKGELIRQEYAYYSFSRSVALPKNVQEDSVTADYKKGILTVTVKKLPESQPKKIKVNIN